MEEAAIIKFNLDILAKEQKKRQEKLNSTTHCITQIRRTLNEAKVKRTIKLIE